MGFIYIIKNKQSPKVYIGQTSRNVEQRFKEHINRDTETKLSQAFKKYGVNNFYYEILEEVDNKMLNEREIYWINCYNSYTCGYNMTPGGFNMDSAIEILKKPVEKRDANTYQIIATYNSVSDAARDMDIDNWEAIRKNICTCCSNKTHTAYGYRWNYVGEEIDTTKRGEKRKKPVLMCDKATQQIIKEFDSAKDANIYLNKTNGSHITDCCKGKLSSIYGYVWKYKEEKNNESNS